MSANCRSVDSAPKISVTPRQDGPVYPQTHVERLFTVSASSGARPAPPGSCRVLELGCASGANLISMATSQPTSHFVGLDLSQPYIEAGQTVVRRLGLANIDLRCLDLCAIDTDFGTFDYVIAHNVYSSVAPAVQDKLLSICRRNTRANGIAYVSYDVYPGSHYRNLVRDMLRHHAAVMGAAPGGTEPARALLDLLAEAVPLGAYGVMLGREVQSLQQQTDSELRQSMVASDTPAYFHEFLEHAGRHGLHYLAEVETEPVVPSLGAALRPWSTDAVRTEQYLDFVRNQAQRQTLLCWDPAALA